MNKRLRIAGLVLGLLCVGGAHAAFAASPTTPFLADIRPGAVDPDVMRLQQYLNASGFAVASTGPGSLANETNYFGTKTKDALIAFQNAHFLDILAPLGLTSGTGNFFASTRTYINAHLVAAASTTPTLILPPLAGGAPHKKRVTYSVSATVSGLSGSGLVLQNNDGNDLSVTGNGTVTFTTKLSPGSAYDVTVLTNPLSPSQTCVVTNHAGTIASANVTTVSVICTTNTYAVTPSGDGNESITPSTVQTVEEGGTQSFVVTANDGYTLSNTVGGTCRIGSWDGNTYTTGVVTQHCTVTFSADVSSYTLTISKTGNATGTVISVPAGINCGSTCTASYSSGTVVNLSALPDSGYTFAGWSGGGCSGTGFCSVTMSAATSVTATFISLLEA